MYSTHIYIYITNLIWVDSTILDHPVIDGTFVPTKKWCDVFFSPGLALKHGGVEEMLRLRKRLQLLGRFFFPEMWFCWWQGVFLQSWWSYYIPRFFQYRKILLAFVDSSLQSFFFGKHGNAWRLRIGCFQHVFRCFHLKHVKTCLEPLEHLRSIYSPFRY